MFVSTYSAGRAFDRVNAEKVERVREIPEGLRLAWIAADKSRLDPLKGAEEACKADWDFKYYGTPIYLTMMILVLAATFTAMTEFTATGFSTAFALKTFVGIGLFAGMFVAVTKIVSRGQKAFTGRMAMYDFLRDVWNFHNEARKASINTDFEVISSVALKGIGTETVLFYAEQLKLVQDEINAVRPESGIVEVEASEDVKLMKLLEQKDFLLRELHKAYNAMKRFGAVEGGYHPYFARLKTTSLAS